MKIILEGFCTFEVEGETPPMPFTSKFQLQVTFDSLETPLKFILFPTNIELSLDVAEQVKELQGA